MAETLGSLADKLTIVKLKQWHSDDVAKQALLATQQRQLELEIDDFVANAIAGVIPVERLVFAPNKVYNEKTTQVAAVSGSLGEVFARLAGVNCSLWHEQEKVYDFERVPVNEKDAVVKQLAVLNLERNECIYAIDRQLQLAVLAKRTTDEVEPK